MPTFKSTMIPLEKTGNFEKTIISYVNGHETLRKLYRFDPDLNGLKNRIDAGENKTVNRELLVKVLKEQYKDIPHSANSKVHANIDSLSDSKTFCVTTGHQLNIFSGPLYVLFKLITTINLSEKLKAEFPAYNFVPVYWMATEDHDIAEINNFNLFSKKFVYENQFEGKSGKLVLTEFDKFKTSVYEVLGNSPFAKEIIALINSAYEDASELGTATRKWTNELLGNYGLVILDADDLRLKRIFSPVIEKELKEQFIENSVNSAIELLKPDFNVQVNPREINLFYLHENTRNRIVKTENGFAILNTELVFSEKEILEELNKYPERFSPNVLMRPVYQEMILPNLAYIGGPSELAYWLELKFIFEKLDLTMPVLFLRNCAMIVEHSALQKWSKLGFEIKDIFRSEHELIRSYLDKKDLGNFSLKQSTEKIAVIFDQISSEISSIDQSLKATAESEKQKSINSISMLEEKVIRAFKRKEETELNQIKKIREKFFPNGNLQERSETLIPFYLKWGNDFISELKNSFDPFNSEFTIFEETEI